MHYDDDDDLFIIIIMPHLTSSTSGHRWLSTASPPGQVFPGRGCREMEFHCGNGRCVPAGPLGLVCDGVNDCGDASDEKDCGERPQLTSIQHKYIQKIL